MPYIIIPYIYTIIFFISSPLPPSSRFRGPCNRWKFQVTVTSTAQDSSAYAWVYFGAPPAVTVTPRLRLSGTLFVY